ncbi:hypothetical protein [Sutcliffiella horikoshii]|uniref:Uncharacterized protein n=1 Tax=Sutcliffiella horikoshii TaxID=79883 RepID=A0A5D4TD22_9BACI|nr:hypothetical protein [Sutcliffiella horikoshii]TYS72412.1 hypothetical protein FZC75_10710 [Sutcliffiella horikoshii]
MSITIANVKIKGSKPLLFNNFTIDSIPLHKKVKSGVAGNNPHEWKNTFQMTTNRQLYLDSRYIFGCLRAGSKYISRGRGSLEPTVSATLQVLSDKLLLNRFVPYENIITTNEDNLVYIDIRPVTRRGVKNIRYRLAIAEGWEASFRIAWENTLISLEQMKAVCLDAGTFAGLGDARKIGYGRFEVLEFKECPNLEEQYYA